MMVRTAFLATLLLGLWLPAAGKASAQTYPSRPISLVVGFAAGGPGDATGRATAEALSIKPR